MRHALAGSLLGAISVALFGCSFDAGTPWHDGPYALTWTDRPADVFLEIREDSGSSQVRVEPCVFAVGADKRWVVAKQHPGGNRGVTNFFVVDASRDSNRAQKSDVVRGPLTEAQFQELARELRLPAFSKTLRSLE